MNAALRPVHIPATDETTYAYAAGVIDGDGHFACDAGSGRAWRFGLVVSMTTPAVPVHLHQQLAGRLATPPGSACCDWRLFRRADVDHVVRRMLPYLRVKHDEGVAMLRLLDALRVQPRYRLRTEHVTRAERAVRRQRRSQWRAAVQTAAEDVRAHRTVPTEPSSLGVRPALPGPPLPGRRIDDVDAAYIAGIIDAEGHLLAAEHSGNIAIKVGSTARILVDWLQHTAGGGVRLSHMTSAGNPYYVWSVHRHTDLELLLDQVMPFLVGKRAEARAMLAAIRFETQLREAGRTVDPAVRRELRLAIRAARPRRRPRPDDPS